MSGNTPALLETRGVTVAFGSLKAVRDVSFVVEKSQICGIIGPNGAGKTTLFNAFSGLVRVSEGEITLNGVRLDNIQPHVAAHAGLGRTFQNLALFDSMSVADNIATGRFSRSHTSFARDLLMLPVSRREEKNTRAEVGRLIERFGLGPYAQSLVGALPFGIRKRVEFARALASDPVLLLLDEPAAGLNHDELATLEDMIRQVRADFDISILLVEHHMRFVMSLCDKIVAMNFGTKIDEGTPAQIQRSDAVINAYLGEPAQHDR